MTDPEISKKLAIAIGWPEKDVFITAGKCLVDTHDLRNKVKINNYWMHGCRVFDHKAWDVAGPVAQVYNCFPNLASAGTWVTTLGAKNKPWPFYGSHAPQTAIALAVIGAQNGN